MKKILSLFLFAILFGSYAFSYDFSAVCESGQTLYYNITSDVEPYTVRVTYPNHTNYEYYYNYTRPTGDLTIPFFVTYNGITYSVTSIDANAFNKCSGLTSVTIHNSITNIGSHVFYNCSGLTTPVYNDEWFVYFPCNYATEYTIPEGIQQIAGGAFAGCSALTSITIPNSVASIGRYAFVNCSGLTSVTIPNSVISIDESAFNNCTGLTSVIIPNSVTSIGYRAFEGCSELRVVTIGNSVTSISSSAFENCGGLTTVNFNATNCTTMGGIAGSNYISAFSNCTALRTINIGNNVTNIPDYAFYGCQRITSITIPNSVTSIGQSAFSRCSGLTSLIIGNSVTSIDNNAFYGCSGLVSVTIGNSVTTIANSAFNGCSGLTTVNFNATNCTTMGSSSNPAFANCSLFDTLNIGENVTNIPAYAFKNCSGLAEITIPNSVTSIGNSAFSGCNGLTSVTIGNSVTTIGNSAFNDCSGLTAVNFNANNCTNMGSPDYSVFNGCNANATINIGEGVTTIPDYAFIGLKGSGTLTIPNSVTSIGISAFNNCSSLSELSIGESVTNIGSYAFKNCSGLSSVTIPNSVTSIGERAFGNCTGLTTINFNATNCTTMGSISDPVFYGCNTNTTIHIGNGVTLIPNFAFWGVVGSGTLIIPNSVTNIGNVAFAECSGFSELLIGESVVTIGGDAFSGCSGLTSVTIPNSVTSIGNSAFYGCNSLTAVNFNAYNCATMGNSSYPVFSNCNANAIINIGEGVTTIPDYAFKGLIGSGTLTIPNSVTSIGQYAFSGCNGLRTVNFNATNCTLGSSNGISGNANITTLNIGENVANIPNSAFQNCSGLTTVNFNATNCTSMGSSSYPVFNGCNANATINIGNGVTTIPDYAFKGLIGSGTLTIPNSVTSIGQYAFYGCNGLTGALTIPNTVTNISTYAFNNCSGLSALTIGSGVASIGSSAFAGCSALAAVYYAGNIGQWCGITFDDQPLDNAHNLYINNNLVTDLVIPENTTEIKKNAFSGATCLTSATIPNTVTSIGQKAFYGCSGLSGTLTIPNSVSSIGNQAFGNCSGLTAVNFNAANCSTMGNSSNPAFGGCTSLSTLSIGENVRSIPANAFYNCNSLRTINFNATNCTSFGSNNGISGNTNITALNIGENVTNIPSSAFNGCTNITGALAIPSAVTSIGGNAFYNCSRITSLSIPNSVTSIGNGAFFNCSGLASISVGSGNSTYDSRDNCNAIIRKSNNQLLLGCNNTVIPESVRSIGSSAFYNCSSLRRVNIPQQLTSLGNDAFAGCSAITEVVVNATSLNSNYTQSPFSAAQTSLKKISLGEGVTRLPNYMFAGCTALDTIIANPTVPPTIYSSTFDYNHVSSTRVIVPCRTADIYSDADFWYNFRRIKQNEPCPTIYTVTALSNNNLFGTVSGGGEYEENSIVTLSATPNYGYRFTAWNDGNEENPRTISVTNDVTYIATFVEIPPVATYTITALSSNPAVGVVTGGGTYYEGTEVTLTANPNEGYAFVSWNDGETLNPRQITVSGDAMYIASFIVASVVTNYEVSVASSNLAYGSVSGSGTYSLGNVVTISATAFDGYMFTSWNDGNTENPRDITVIGDAMYVANFAVIPPTPVYTLTVLSINNAYGSVSGGGEYEENAVATLTATPNDGYEFTSWSDGSTDNPHEVTVTRNAMYIAYFDEIPQTPTYNITVIASNPNHGSVTGGGVYEANAEVTLTAIANEGYRFDVWSDGSTDNPRSITVTSDAMYVANFVEIQPTPIYTLTVLSINNAYGSVSGGGEYEENSVATLRATPNDGYEFTSWSDGSTDNPHEVIVTRNAMYVAYFDEIPQTPTYNITVIASNPNHGSVTGGGVYEANAEVTLTAIANEGYRFDVWSDGSTDNPRNITVTSDAMYVANFVEIPETPVYTLTVLSINNAYGSVSGGGEYEENAVATLSATANEGYEFTSWSDGSTDNPHEVTVTRDAMYVAYFDEIPQTPTYNITVIASNPNHGSVTGGGVYEANAEVTLTATAFDGCRFDVWSDGSTDSIRTITVTSDAIYIANFVHVDDAQTIYVTVVDTACGSYTWNNVTYTESGTYYRTFTAANSADSIVALGLVILPLPEPVITVDGILDACNPETTSVTLSAGEYSTYIWSTNETSETIVVSTPGYYFVEVVDSFGCHGNSEEMIIGYSTILTDAPMVKNLGMNASGYISFSWTAPQTEGIAGYEIYREDNTMDVFRHISSVGRNRKSIIDTTANPSERAYRYMVCAVDECGGMSPMSVPHKSVHLTINQGIDNSWNLIWSHYEGFELSSYIIYRGRTTSDMVVIDTVPSNLNSYTDYSNPDNEGFFYKVRPEKNTRSRTNDEDEDDDEMLSSNIVDNGHIVMRTVMAVTSNPLSGTVSGSGVYADGTQIEIEAIANEGYEFAAWNDGSIANPRSVTITSDTLFIANFVEIPQMATYTITVYSSNQAYGTVTGGGTYPEGTEITLTAIANSGYEFVSWSDGNSDNPRTLIVTNDAMFIATFVEASSVASYTITVISSNPTNGSVTGGGTYLEGTVISIEAIANEGYEFISWNDNNIDNPREITVTGDAMYIASFVPATDIAESAVPEISVYPNPVEDILNITSSVDIAEIEIVNVIGQIVLRKDVNSGSTVCDVAGLPSGVYTVRIRMLGGLEASEGMTTQMKFVKE